MFPALSQRLTTRFLSRLDVIVELSTLGQYGIAEDGLPLALEAEGCDRSPVRSRSRDLCAPDMRLSTPCSARA